MKLIDLIAGARPNFMKIAPLIDAFDRASAQGSRLRYRLVHTGQHYDYAMSGSFFDELKIPAPDLNLEVGAGSHAEQTAAIMIRYEQVLKQRPCDLCLVVGDVTSTMACAITARKLGIPVAHVEAGVRSGDWAMPEEINRVVTDSITTWFFTTTETANRHLRAAGIPEDRIFFVGNPMIDTLFAHLPHLRRPPCWDSLQLQPRQYFVVTLHRPANVDETTRLLPLLQSIAEGAQGVPVIFPVHPRTAKQLRSHTGHAPRLTCITPLGYLEFNYLVRHAKGVITDSGGVTQETTALNVPCLTLRDTTEYPETIEMGTNALIGTDPARLRSALNEILAGQWKQALPIPRWDGHAGERTVTILSDLLADKT